MNLLQELQRIGHPRVLVLGDLILDRYTWGRATRVSPEAPVLILDADEEEVRLGGAASVARLLRGLDAVVSVAGVVGDDSRGRTLRRLFSETQIEQNMVLSAPSRPTTTKQRFMGRAATRHPHQILRVDYERRDPLDRELEQRLTEAVLAQLHGYAALLISDYGKGVCMPHVLDAVIETAGRIQLPILVDPARGADYRRYRNVTILKPNRVEAELATGRKIVTPDDALLAGRQLCRQCHVRAVVVTLDHQGMAIACADGVEHVVSTRPREVYDITGAGDMALAMLSLGQASELPLPTTAELAAVAAGLEVERLGVGPVSRSEIQAELRRLDRPAGDNAGKRVTLDEMAALADAYRRAGRTIVFTNGCFDLLHVGHVAYLREAARLGSVLVVAVNGDRSVKRLKASNRPIIGQEDRAALLSAMECVDHVLLFDDDTPHELLRRIRPDVLVKGGTYAPDEVVGREIVLGYGGKVCVAGKIDAVSTTAIVAKVTSAFQAESDNPSPTEPPTALALSSDKMA